MATVTELNVREILDSRGNPTAGVEVLLGDGAVSRAAVPSSASTGVHETHELHDDEDHYLGKGIEKAIRAVLEEIEDIIIGLEAEDQHLVGRTMIELDDTESKSRLSTNAIPGVSMAVTKAAAESAGLDLFRYVGGPNSHVLPAPMMDILDGGAHTDFGVGVQEFTIAPVGTPTFKEALRVGAEVYHVLRRVIRDKGLSTDLDDEDGFAPLIDSTKAALDLVVEATKATGYKLDDDVALALDVTSSELYKDGKYHFEGGGHTAKKMTAVHADLIENYAIVPIEDPLQEDNWGGYTEPTAQTGNKVRIVDDDFPVTSPKCLAEDIERKTVNTLLVRVNQTGSLSETFEAIMMTHNAGYKTTMSHRPSETEDTTIVDLAIGLNCSQVKTGAPACFERVTKYNQLLHTEEYLGNAAIYVGRSAFPRSK